MSNPFKIGDEVEIILPNKKQQASYAGGWVGGMDAYVGRKSKVVRLDKETGVYIESFGSYTYDVRYVRRVESATVTEKDPSGIDQHAPGAKLDAGKLRPALVLDGFANALEAVVKVGTDGAAKYTDNGWKEVANGFARYSDAEGRHRMKRGKGETHDKDSGSLHLAHEAWNALAKLELYLKDNA